MDHIVKRLEAVSSDTLENLRGLVAVLGLFCTLEWRKMLRKVKWQAPSDRRELHLVRSG